MLKWLLGAAAVALVLLFTVVLPAEYGYDPTRIGRLLGLTSMHESRGTGEQGLDTVIEDLLGDSDSMQAAAAGDPMQPTPLPNPGVSQLEDAPPKSETLRIQLDFDERTEIKAVMEKHKAFVYGWKVQGGEVYVDFHGHDPARGDDFWVRYEEAGQEQGVSARNGSLVAPFAGEHGWYWLNVSQGPITIELTVTGYFKELKNYGLLQ
jgi:hypothetical protein